MGVDHTIVVEEYSAFAVTLRFLLITMFRARRLLEEFKGGDGTLFTKFFEVMEKENLDGTIRFDFSVSIPLSSI